LETKDFFKREFLCWDDVSHLGAAERKAVILDDGQVKPSQYGKDKMDFVITLQLVSNKEIHSFRLNRNSWNNLKEAWGTKSEDWREKIVYIDNYEYADNKQGVVLKVWHGDKPKEKIKEKATKTTNIFGDVLSNPEIMASIGQIMAEMKSIKKEETKKG